MSAGAVTIAGEIAIRWACRHDLLSHDHPRLDAAISANFVRVDASSSTFLARPNLAFLFGRDVVIAACDEVVSERAHDEACSMEGV